MEEFIVDSPQKMEKLGALLSEKLKGNEVIGLKGPLGAGKTTFVRGLVKALGLKENYQVRSPTFTLVNEYPTRKGKVLHVDLYRVRDFDYSELIGEGILVVEWEEDPKKCDIFVEIDVLDENTRRVRINEKGSSCLLRRA